MSGVIILLLAAVFLFAAMSKLRSQNEFGEVLKNLVPGPLVNAAALVIPLSELVLAAFLLSGIAPKLAAIISAVVLAVFTVFLIAMRRRGVKGCGCFGEDSNTDTTGSGIIRNMVLIALAAFVAMGSPDILIYRPDASTFVGRMTVVAGALCLWPCVVAIVNRRKLIINFSKA